MTLQCVHKEDPKAYRRTNSERVEMVEAVYNSLKEYQRNPNNTVRRYIFGHYLNNVVVEQKHRYDRTLRVNPHRLSNDQMRFLRKAKDLADKLEVPFAEVIYSCRNVGTVGSVVPNTIREFGKALLELDSVRNANPLPLEEYILRALHIHAEGVA